MDREVESVQMMRGSMRVYVCEQLREVILPSGKRFQFHYDESSRGLSALVTPTQRRHEFERLLMPHIDRLVYRAPHINDSFLVDYDTQGRLLSVFQPQRARRVDYSYASDSADERDFDVLYDASHVRHRRRSRDDYTQQTSSVEHADVNCSCVIERTDNVTVTSVRVTSTCGESALFVRRRDVMRRVTTLDAVVAGRHLPATERTVSANTGHVTHASPFTCHHRRHCVSDDTRVNVTRHYDALSQLTRLVMSFHRHVVFTLQVRTSAATKHSLLDYFSQPIHSPF